MKKFRQPSIRKIRSILIGTPRFVVVIAALAIIGSGAALASIGIGGNIFGNGDSVNLQQGLVGHWKMDNKNNRTVISDDFSGGSLDTDTWVAFGETHGSISVNNNELTISNTSGGQEDFIGIRSQQRLPVGTTMEAKVRHTEGLHAGVVAFGEDPFHPFPHAGTGNVGASIYSRGPDAVRSYRDESGNADWLVVASEKLTDHKVKISRIDDNTVEYYINDVLVDTINQPFSGDYYIYFSANGYTKPNTMVIEWTEITSPTAEDSTPHDNDGIVYGPNLIQDRFGNADSAYELDGDTGLVEVNNFENFPSTAITTSFWVKTTDSSDGTVSYASSGHTNDWLLFSSGSLTVYRGSSGAIGTGVSFNDGEWHHIAVSWQSSDGQTVVYKDGQQVFTGTLATGTTITGNGCLIFGQEQDAICGGYQATQAFGGTMDDIRIYDRVLNGSEVTALNEAQHPPSEIRVSDLQKDLAGHWDMNGDAKDRTPWSNHGTINDVTLTDDRRDQSGNAYLFNGSTGHIDIPGVSKLKPDGEISISGWFYRNAQGAGWNPVVQGAGDLNNATGYYFGFSSNSNVFRMTVGDGSYVNATSTLNTGQWYHAVGVFSADGGFIKLYIDGVEVSSAAHTKTSISYESYPIAVGRLAYSLSTGHRFDGVVDDLRIYDRVLNAEEIGELHESYRPVIQMSDLSKGLTGHWDMNGDAKDRTPWSNHGTLTGTPVPATNRHGRSDSAYEFDGVSDYIVSSDQYDFLNTDSFSAATWVYFEDHSDRATAAAGVLGKGHFFADTWDIFLYNSHRFSFELGSGSSGSRRVFTPTNLPTQTWHHVAAVYNGDSRLMQIYLNGELQDSQTYDLGFHFNNGNNLHLAARPSDSLRRLDGKLDDARIYDRVLSAEEVKMLHETYR